jgi:short-subunit dehydrogenase
MITTFLPRRKADILIFKTNIRYKKDLHKVAPLLKAEQKIRCWNVDLGDIDKVLRIEAEELTTGQVTELIQQAGYQCEELTD